VVAEHHRGRAADELADLGVVALTFLVRLAAFGDQSPLLFTVHALLLAVGVFCLALGCDLIEVRKHGAAFLAFAVSIAGAVLASPDLSVIWTFLLGVVTLGKVRAANWYRTWQKGRIVGRRRPSHSNGRRDGAS